MFPSEWARFEIATLEIESPSEIIINFMSHMKPFLGYVGLKSCFKLKSKEILLVDACLTKIKMKCLKS